ncbi:hypothetical protein LEMLEM_LOCUS16465 [Lemmus lemmus]
MSFTGAGRKDARYLESGGKPNPELLSEGVGYRDSPVECWLLRMKAAIGDPWYSGHASHRRTLKIISASRQPYLGEGTMKVLCLEGCC